MMHEWVAKYITHYSFIKNYERKGAFWIFNLQDNCKIKSFKMPIGRTTKETLIKKIEHIKDKIGYDRIKKDWVKQNESSSS